MVAISIIALALVTTTTSFNHPYTALAAPKKGGSTASHTNSITTLGGGSSSSSSAATAPNTNALIKKELSSLISCINTANKSQGLTHKVVTNCLDIASGRLLLLPLPQVVVPHQ